MNQLTGLGFTMNLEKSYLETGERTRYLGLRLHLLSCHTFRMEDRILQSMSLPFSAGENNTRFKLCLGLMASVIFDLHSGLLMMRNFHLYGCALTAYLGHSVKITPLCIVTLRPWRNPPAFGDSDHRCIPVRLGWNHDGSHECAGAPHSALGIEALPAMSPGATCVSEKTPQLS